MLCDEERILLCIKKYNSGRLPSIIILYLAAVFARNSRISGVFAAWDKRLLLSKPQDHISGRTTIFVMIYKALARVSTSTVIAPPLRRILAHSSVVAPVV